MNIFHSFDRIASYGNDSALRDFLEGHLTLFRAEGQQFKNEVAHLKTMFELITQIVGKMPLRQKRSLLPFVGDALSWLFGTASDSQIRKIQEGIGKLKNAQNGIVHVVDHSLTLINQTMTATIENRKAIDAIVLSQTALDHNVKEIGRL